MLELPIIRSIIPAEVLTPWNVSVLGLLVLVFLLRPRWITASVKLVRAGVTPMLERSWLAMLVVAAVPLLIRAALLPIAPIPPPLIHDEFANLLAADTFSHGRLTNPTHPLWRFFETFHVNQYPTYMSMYPPLAGAVLASGKVLFGHPWWGAFAITGVACAVSYWAMKAWIPASWAFLAASMLGLNYSTGHQWMDSYFVTPAAATGGALLLGAYGRLRQARHATAQLTPCGISLALGVAILANSRPWEGLVYSLPFAAALLFWMARPPAEQVTQRLWKVVLPAAAILTGTAAFMGYYCWRNTGDPFRMPYLLNRDTYAITTLFAGQPFREPPEYRHDAMRRFYLEFEPAYQDADRTPGPATLYQWTRHRLKLVEQLWGRRFFSLLLIAFMVPLWRRKELRFALVVLAVFCGGLMIQRYCQLHYLAPVACLGAMLGTAAVRELYDWRPRGDRLGAALALAVILCAALATVTESLHLSRYLEGEPNILRTVMERREVIRKELERTAGKDLVLVHYHPDRTLLAEWVYNDADIDGSEVVWAREMSPGENFRLFDYFRERRLWRLDADADPPILSPLER